MLLWQCILTRFVRHHFTVLLACSLVMCYISGIVSVLCSFREIIVFVHAAVEIISEVCHFTRLIFGHGNSSIEDQLQKLFSLFVLFSVTWIIIWQLWRKWIDNIHDDCSDLGLTLLEEAARLAEDKQSAVYNLGCQCVATSSSLSGH